MAMFAVRKVTWNSFSANHRVIISNLDEHLILGSPAEFKAGAIRWLVFDDHRFTSLMVGRLGLLFANPGRVGEARDRLDADVVKFSGEDWQSILDAQGAPNSIRMTSGVPESWTAVSEE